MTLRSNKYIIKILDSSYKYWKKDIKSLSLEQILWRFENTYSIIGIIGKPSIFSDFKELLLLKRDDGRFVLLSPSNKKDKYPCYLYDISDIKKFVEKYKVRLIDNNNDELFFELDKIKNEKTRGYIDIDDDFTYVYEFI